MQLRTLDKWQCWEIIRDIPVQIIAEIQFVSFHYHCQKGAVIMKGHNMYYGKIIQEFSQAAVHSIGSAVTMCFCLYKWNVQVVLWHIQVHVFIQMNCQVDVCVYRKSKQVYLCRWNGQVHLCSSGFWLQILLWLWHLHLFKIQYNFIVFLFIGNGHKVHKNDGIYFKLYKVEVSNGHLYICSYNFQVS